MVREEERIFNDLGFGLRAYFARRYDARILSARTHSCTLKHFNFFFFFFNTSTLQHVQTVLPKTLYPNPNPTEIPLP